jgi:hypothetical protein
LGLGLALGAFLKCLFNREFAHDVQGLALGRKSCDSSRMTEPLKDTSSESKVSIPVAKSETETDGSAVQMLAELQKEGRLIDFLEEDLSQYEDEEIGSSVRTIHEGCKKVLDHCLDKEKIIDQEEESSVRVNGDYDVHELKLSGRVSDRFPLKGVLVHPGWKVTSFKLKERSSHPSAQQVLAPAEVEIG